MTSFQEFLKKKADERRDDAARQEREEWVASVTGLLEQIVAWLRQDDEERVLEIAFMEEEKDEQSIGHYRVPFLFIRLGGAVVRIKAVSRGVVGAVGRRGEIADRADGLVEITRGGERRRLYRVVADGRETWYAVDEDHDARPFDKERLEEILLDLLS